MGEVNACQIPEELFYDVERDVWLRFEPDGSVVAGMTDPAQTRAGRILHVQPRPAGKLVQRGRSAATIESAKWVGPFPMPLTGIIAEVNAAVVADPNLINRDTYGGGWIVRLRPTNLDAERGELSTGADALARYQARIEQLGITCIRCEP